MNSIVSFEGGAVPAHIARRFSDAPANTDLSANVGGGGYPVISYKGKVWHVVRGDERTLVANEEGEPKASLEVVILKSNPNLSKIYYPGGYEEGSSAKPTCYSNDGHGPASDVLAPQSKSCAACPHNAWGSRVTENGAKGKACSDSRRVAVAPIGDLENPMLLRIPAATLKELTAYADLLNRRKAPYQAVVTKIGFDHTVAHQKLTFRAVRWLSEEEDAVVQEVCDREVIKNITGISGAPDLMLEGTPPSSARQAEPEPAKAPTPRAAKQEVVEAEIEEILAPAPEPDPAPVAMESKVKALIADADASLDDVLRMLDD